MQQRAALVRALSYKPSVLLMDEPFGALDAFTREEMNRLVEEIWLDTRTTIVLITHSIEEAIFLSDRVVVMSPRPGRVANIHEVPFPRPRSLEIMSTKEVFDLTNAIKLEIVGDAAEPLPAARRAHRRCEPREDNLSDTDAIPEFKAKPGGGRRRRHHQHVRPHLRPGHQVDGRGAGDRPRRRHHHRRHRAAAQYLRRCRNTCCPSRARSPSRWSPSFR